MYRDRLSSTRGVVSAMHLNFRGLELRICPVSHLSMRGLFLLRTVPRSVVKPSSARVGNTSLRCVTPTEAALISSCRWVPLRQGGECCSAIDVPPCWTIISAAAAQYAATESFQHLWTWSRPPSHCKGKHHHSHSMVCNSTPPAPPPTLRAGRWSFSECTFPLLGASMSLLVCPSARPHHTLPSIGRV